jgi:hypothetical protein
VAGKGQEEAIAIAAPCLFDPSSIQLRNFYVVTSAGFRTDKLKAHILPDDRRLYISASAHSSSTIIQI